MEDLIGTSVLVQQGSRLNRLAMKFSCFIISKKFLALVTCILLFNNRATSQSDESGLDSLPVLAVSLAVRTPLKTLTLTSSFGWRVHPLLKVHRFHLGVDLAARSEIVYSVTDGTVYAMGVHPSLGRFICIRHRGLECIYGHLSVIAIMPGQMVSSGQPIAITGSTGKVTGEHLHFAVRYLGKYIHPLRFLIGLTSDE